jgi:hypothetical protein
VKQLFTVAVAALSLIAAGAQAAELGRLFLTPQERAALDRARHAVQAPVITQPEHEPEPIDVTPEAVRGHEAPITVDGYVSRSGGPATVWVNGTDTFQGDLSEFGINAEHVEIETSRVRLPIGAAETPVLLKPGQSFDPGANAISDAYERRDSP